ncbi:MAG: hypothetical protein HC848_09780 [Limnobacter sp.]|nr:hypothetical protein [Limnobacter sp.]
MARLSIESRTADWPGGRIVVDRGQKLPMAPAALNRGTRVEVEDLFSATPALLAFVCASATGLLFGYLPARKAARLILSLL